jgi:hypothetical protein
MGWWRRNREQDLGRELRAHLELETEEQRDSGFAPRRGALCRAARFRQRNFSQGGHTRHVGMDIGRNTLSGPSVAGQILEYVFWPAKWWLGIDDPILPEQLP